MPQNFSLRFTLCFRGWRSSASYQCCWPHLCIVCCTAFTRRTGTRWIFCIDLRKASLVLGRIEAFRNGIFAIVVTVLVVDLKTHVDERGSDHV